MEKKFSLLESPGFVLMHLACVAVVWTGVSRASLIVAALLYVTRMFGLTGGYHRYFSHRSYKTSRVFQFLLAFLGGTSAEQGALWWAAHHRHHHKYSETEEDVHSPVAHGLFWSHVGWIMSPKFHETNYEVVSDLSKYPELRFLNRFYLLPPLTLAAALWALGAALERYSPGSNTSGAQMFVVGFLIGTVVLQHCSFTINSLAHVLGRRRFETKDNSRNSALLAVITLGEGWHNNHHFAPSSERQGFYWWEIDVTHYVLKGLALPGLVWDLQPPPRRVFARAADSAATSPRARRAAGASQP
jgi:stearoyl-CoA desaturase (delta-9 desaturase)